MWRVVAIILVAVAVAAGPAHAASGPESLTLRLGDLPPGYLVGDDSGCGLALIGEGMPRALADLRRHPHRGCGAQFEQLWAPPGIPPGPPLVESVSLRFATEAGAEAGIGKGTLLLAAVFGLRRASLDVLPASPGVGATAAAFSTDDALVEGRDGRPGVAVVWRTGRVLSLLLAAGQGGTAAETTAFGLAGAQERRVRAPTPLRRADNDDRQVPLGNPALGIQVLWLGERFRPGGGLPALALADSYGPLERGAGPGWVAELDYGARGSAAGVKLGLWKPRAFARFRRSRLGRLVWTQRCARAIRVALPNGRAVIHGGHTNPPRRCGARPPDRWLAHVFLDDLVVSVNVPVCLRCVGPEEDRPDPYDSRAGMRAVVRGLRERAGAVPALP